MFSNTTPRGPAAFAAAATVLAVAAMTPAQAQAPDPSSLFGGPTDTVTWTAAPQTSAPVKPGARVAIKADRRDRL